jgi:anti-sigma regulatory factor (Ser/Thr protein kinase)
MVVEAELPRHPNAAYQARALVAGFPSDLDRVQLDDAILAVSELVANAYRHGKGRITLRLESLRGGVRAQVGDEGPGFDPRAAPGAGLGIVGAVSDAWGHNGAKTEIWFEIGPPATTNRK